MIGIGDLERGNDGRLLSRIVGVVGCGWCTGPTCQHTARNRVHLGACRLQLLFGALADLLTRKRRVECEGQLAIVELRTDAKLALRFRHEALVEPDLVLRDRLASLIDAALELRLFFFRQHAEIRDHQLIDQRQHPAVLFRGRFSVDLRNARGVERLTHLREQSREFVQPGAHVAEPIGQRREVPRQQRVQSTACEVGVDQRIPAPVLQIGGAPDVVFELACEQARIDLMRTRQLRSIDGAQGLQELEAEGEAALAALCADVVQFVIEAMVAERSGRHGREREHVVEPSTRQCFEGLVFQAGTAGCWRLRRLWGATHEKCSQTETGRVKEVETHAICNFHRAGFLLDEAMMKQLHGPWKHCRGRASAKLQTRPVR